MNMNPKENFDITTKGVLVKSRSKSCTSTADVNGFGSGQKPISPKVKQIIAAQHLYGSSYEIDEDYDDDCKPSFEKEFQIRKLAAVYNDLLLTVGEDTSRPGLKKTPERAAKALWYFTKGYRQNIKGNDCNCCFCVK